MHKPRVRNWLFWSDAPTLTHLVESLRKGPMLNGFVFTAHAGEQHKTFPDIGDLETVFSVEDDVILGITFGYRGINPVIPIVVDLSDDSFLADASYIVRRTARQLIKLNDLLGYISIELSWMKTGYLVVKSSVQGLQYVSNRTLTAGSVMDEVEMRIFSPEQTRKLVQQEEQLRYHSDLFNDSSHGQFHSLPGSFARPSCSFIIRVREPDKIGVQGSFKNPMFRDFSQNDSAAKDPCPTSIAACQNTSLTQWSSLLSRGTWSSSSAYNSVMQSWNRLCHFIGKSRLQGNYRSTVHRSETDLGDWKQLMKQDSEFLFLVNKGHLAARRIHHLCTLLGIDYARPEIDSGLYKSSRLEGEGHGHDAENPNAQNSNQLMISNYPYSYDRSMLMHEREFSHHLNESYDSDDCFDLGADEDQNFLRNGNLTFSSVSTDKGKRRRVAGHVNDFDDLSGSGYSCRADESFEKPTATSSTELQNILPSEELCNSPACSRNQWDSSEGPQLSGEDIPAAISGTSRIESEATIKDGKPFSAPEGRKIRGSGPNEVWECAICQANIKGKRGNLKRHIEFKHYNIRRFECLHQGCGRKFHNRLNLKRHEEAVHEGRPFKCSECPRDFKNKSDLDSHFQKSHDGRKERLACDICGGCFGYKSSLYRHRRTVHGQESVLDMESQSRLHS